MEDPDAIDLKILETISALSTVPGVSSHRGVHPEEVTEKLKLSERDYLDRVDDLRRRGLLQVSTGWVVVPTSKGWRVLQKSGKSSWLERPWENIYNEYKDSPVKTLSSTLAIVVLIFTAGIFIFNNFIYHETPPSYN